MTHHTTPSRHHFIVIGNPIAHSKSPQIHQAFAKQVGLPVDYQRLLCPIDAESFTAVTQAFAAGGGDGANVTVPFKEMAYALCQEQGQLTPHAKVAGAVNTLYWQKVTSSDSDTAHGDTRLLGDNTDGLGLVNHLRALGWDLTGKRLALIGAGGAARGVILPLLQAGVAQMTIANRTLSKASDMLTDMSVLDATVHDTLIHEQLHLCAIEDLTGEYDLIINATSTGLANATLPLSSTLHAHHAYDMMYGRELPFLQHFAQRGSLISDGMGMLTHQAALSFQLWTGKQADAMAVLTQLKTDNN